MLSELLSLIRKECSSPLPSTHTLPGDEEEVEFEHDDSVSSPQQAGLDAWMLIFSAYQTLRVQHLSAVQDNLILSAPVSDPTDVAILYPQLQHATIIRFSREEQLQKMGNLLEEHFPHVRISPEEALTQVQVSIGDKKERIQVINLFGQQGAHILQKLIKNNNNNTLALQFTQFVMNHLLSELGGETCDLIWCPSLPATIQDLFPKAKALCAYLIVNDEAIYYIDKRLAYGPRNPTFLKGLEGEESAWFRKWRQRVCGYTDPPQKAFRKTSPIFVQNKIKQLTGHSHNTMLVPRGAMSPLFTYLDGEFNNPRSSLHKPMIGHVVYMHETPQQDKLGNIPGIEDEDMECMYIVTQKHFFYFRRDTGTVIRIYSSDQPKWAELIRYIDEMYMMSQDYTLPTARRHLTDLVSNEILIKPLSQSSMNKIRHITDHIQYAADRRLSFLHFYWHEVQQPTLQSDADDHFLDTLNSPGGAALLAYFFIPPVTTGAALIGAQKEMKHYQFSADNIKRRYLTVIYKHLEMKIRRSKKTLYSKEKINTCIEETLDSKSSLIVALLSEIAPYVPWMHLTEITWQIKKSNSTNMTLPYLFESLSLDEQTTKAKLLSKLKKLIYENTMAHDVPSSWLTTATEYKTILENMAILEQEKVSALRTLVAKHCEECDLIVSTLSIADIQGKPTPFLPGNGAYAYIFTMPSGTPHAHLLFIKRSNGSKYTVEHATALSAEEATRFKDSFNINLMGGGDKKCVLHKEGLSQSELTSMATYTVGHLAHKLPTGEKISVGLNDALVLSEMPSTFTHSLVPHAASSFSLYTIPQSTIQIPRTLLKRLSLKYQAAQNLDSEGNSYLHIVSKKYKGLPVKKSEEGAACFTIAVTLRRAGLKWEMRNSHGQTVPEYAQFTEDDLFIKQVDWAVEYNSILCFKVLNFLKNYKQKMEERKSFKEEWPRLTNLLQDWFGSLSDANDTHRNNEYYKLLTTAYRNEQLNDEEELLDVLDMIDPEDFEARTGFFGYSEFLQQIKNILYDIKIAKQKGEHTALIDSSATQKLRLMSLSDDSLSTSPMYSSPTTPVSTTHATTTSSSSRQHSLSPLPQQALNAHHPES